MQLDQALLQAASRELLASSSVMLLTHVRPDGDAIGSMMGLGLALREASKEVQMVLPDGMPSSYRFLPGSDLVIRRPQAAVDFICVVDCSDLGRPGDVLEEGRIPDLNIDHHITNLNFARLNLVDTAAVSTTQIIQEILRFLEWPLSPFVAAALLTGLITDTIGFRTPNVTSHALRQAADLMDAGGDLADLYQRSLISKSYEAARLWGAGLSRLERDGRLVWTTLTLEDRRSANYPGRDDADLINLLSSIDSADVVIIFTELTNGQVKVSWRSQPGFDVSQVALAFGGGGHAAASGAEITGSLQQVQTLVLEATRPVLSGNDFGVNSANPNGPGQSNGLRIVRSSLREMRNG